MTQNVKNSKKWRSPSGPRVYKQPDRKQAAVIFFHMKMQGITEAQIAKDIGVSNVMVHWVISGVRTSGRVSKGIAQALGYDNWNELIMSVRGLAA